MRIEKVDTGPGWGRGGLGLVLGVETDGGLAKERFAILNSNA